jgi:DNA polymerase (family 10)
MKNQEIAEILRGISEYLSMEGDSFKARAYERVADNIEFIEASIADIYRNGGQEALQKIEGVGISIAEKIGELIRTKKIKYYEELKKKTPVDLANLTKVEGLGPQKIKRLYKELKIKNVADLEKAARAGKISKLEGFGEKSEDKILKGIEFLKGSGTRVILGYAVPIAREIEEHLKKLKEVEKVVIAGSIIRRKETIGDIDILVVSKSPKKVMKYFVSLPQVINVSAEGETKSSVKIKGGINVDLRVVPRESFGAALNYFTGSKDHNVSLRQLAIDYGYKLNEYGLFKGKKNIAGKTEEEIYKKLGLDFIVPELRETTGEIDAAREGKLPKLINYKDLRGDLQVQTSWTDGKSTILEMAEAAISSGLDYIAITDHTKRLAMTGGLDEKRLAEQGKEIDRINTKIRKKNPDFLILKGTECDILKDGSMDLNDKALSNLDVVGASVHSYFNLSKREQTDRIVKAMRNRHVDIIFHPTGRLIGKRAAYELDMDEIIRVAKETGTILEIDAYPDRSDLKDEYIRKCVEAGVKLSIDSDAHAINHLQFLEYGIAQARRGWAKKSDIINAWPVEKMLKLLKNA